MIMRLQKFIAAAGICSRRKAEAHIQAGRVKVNDKIVTELGTKVDTETDTVLFDNEAVRLSGKPDCIYIALNKPEGYVSSCSHKGERIILDLVDIDRRIYPVGRLDKNSRGLILLTDDGALHHRLSHPSFNHEKAYVVETAHPVSDAALKKMAQGVVLEGKKTREAKTERLSEDRFKIVLKEGRNRQIRKMVTQTGNRVQRLQRIRISNVSLDGLKEGQWRYLAAGEVRKLYD